MSNDEQLRSPSGAPIYNYSNTQKDWKAPEGQTCTKEISDHIQRHIGPINTIYREVAADQVQVDIHHVKPDEYRKYHTLVTSGMSDLPMKVPAEFDDVKHTELLVFLPESWEVSEEAFEIESWYWPVKLLKYLARFPHKYNTWLGLGHTIPNGDPAQPFADNTALSGLLILPPVNVPESFLQLNIDAQKTIHFYCLIPLYQEEMELKLKKGTNELLKKLSKNGVSDLISIDRKNTGKKFLGIF